MARTKRHVGRKGKRTHKDEKTRKYKKIHEQETKCVIKRVRN